MNKHTSRNGIGGRRAATVAAAIAAVLVLLGALTVLAVTHGDRDRPGAGPTPEPTISIPAAPPTSAPATPPASSSPPGPTPSRQPPPPSSAPGLPQHLRGKDIEHIPTTRPIVALTFDAGSNADGLTSILGTLATAGVTGTFFVTGDFADRHPDSVRAIAARGHRLANHSYSHPYFTQKSDVQLRAELARGEAAIRALGADPRPLFRFPYGDRDSRTITAVNAAGYACVRWTVDTLGWKGTSEGITAQRVVDRVLSTARAGQIVLMHVGSHPKDRSTLDADALATVISRLRDRGYSFVTLNTLLTG